MPTEWPDPPKALHLALLIIRGSLAALVAAGALCLPETGLAAPYYQSPTFTTQPASHAVSAGNTATFTAGASGSPVYQWYFAFNGVTNLIAGATDTSLNVPGNYINQGNYFCVASNSYGATTSSVVTLDVQYGWTSFNYTGYYEGYTVPPGVTNLAVDAIGSGAGSGGSDAGVCGGVGGPRIWFWGVVGVNDGGTVSMYLGGYGGNGENQVTGTGGGQGGWSAWTGGWNGGNGGAAGASGSSGGGGGGGPVSLIIFPSSLSNPDLVLGGAGGGGGGGSQGRCGTGQGEASYPLPSSDGYYPNDAYNGGQGATSFGDGGGGGGGGGGIWDPSWGGGFGNGDTVGGGGSGGYSFQPDNIVPPGNPWNYNYASDAQSSAMCAFRPAPLALISMPGTNIGVLSGQSLSLTAQIFTQDTVEYIAWYCNGNYYNEPTVNSLGNGVYNSTLDRGTGYTNGEVWTVQIETYLYSYWGEEIFPVAISTPTTVSVLLTAPVITSEPTNLTVFSSSNASFSVTATGAVPLSYQWWANEAEISGATNASFSLAGALMSDAGSYTVVVSNAYGSVTSSVAALTVNQTTPAVSAWPVASGIIYPQTLSASALLGGSGSVDGTFVFANPAAILNVGTNLVSVVFTPNDAADYATVNGAVAISVAQGVVGITALPTASPITFGQSLASSSLTNGSATVDGNFTFANNSVTPAGAGSYSAVVLFTATNTNYSVFTTNIAVTVNKATATVVLSGTNQNYSGTATSVTATPTPAGLEVDVTYNGSSIPPVTAGSYAVVATVNDTNYAGAATGTLLVGKIPLLVAAQNATNGYGATNAPFTVVANGFTNGETLNALSGSLTFTVEDTNNTVISVDTNTPAGTYTIIPGGLASSDYTITYTNGALTILPAILTVTADSLTNVYGSPMPALTWSYQGFTNGEGTNVLSGAPSLSTNLSSGSPVAGSPYAITITNGTLSASNYVFLFNCGTFTVLPAALGVNANSVTNVYGSPLPALTGSMAGVTNNDPLSVSFTTVATRSSNAGAYDILPLFNDPSLLANYTVTTNVGTFTVTPAPLLVTADNQTRAYGYANPTLTITYSGFAAGDDATKLDVAPIATTSATLTSLRGLYPISVGGGVSGNYTFTYVNGSLTVTKAPLTIVGNNASRPYGGANPAFSATITGAMNNDNITARFSTSATTNSAPGDYIIQLSVSDPGGKLGQYDTTLNSGILTVSGASLIGTVENVSRAYGQTNPVFTVTYGGFVNSQDASLVTGDLIFACTDTNGVSVDTNSPVGTYPILVAGGQTAPNYIIQYTNGTLTVTQAVLTVAANATNRVYGAANPSFTSIITGYVNGEDSNVLSGTLNIASPSDATSPVGTYSIIPSGVSATNYSIKFSNGELTVTQAPLFVSASNASRLYGQSNPTLTGSVTGLANNDNLGLTFVTAATPASPVGNYDIAPAFGDPDSKLSNYQLTNNNGTLTVGQAPLTVVAANQTRIYGQSNPTLTGTVSGVVNGDNITASYSTTATAESPVGSYSIVPLVNDPQSKLANYAVSSTDGTLAVTTASLVVTASYQTRVYGATNPTFTATFNGFVNGQTSSVLGGTLSVTSPADPASPTGTYPIIPGGLSASNYLISYANGTLTVSQAALTVTANPAARSYGATNPVFSATISGFVNGDNTNVISGQAALSTSAGVSSPVGTYGILAAQGNLSAVNYTFSFNNGTLTVTPASLTGSVQNAARAYGQTNPVFSVSYSGFVNSQDSGVVSGPIAFSCLDTNNAPVDTNTPVGVYPIDVITPQTAPNYTIGYVDGTLAVTQAVLTVSADPQSRLYGTTNPALTVTYSGFLNADGTNVISGQPDLSTAAYDASPVGSYAIVVGLGSLSATNYSFSLTNGTLTVGKALLTVTADNQTRLYGQTNPVFTVQYSGFVEGDNASVLSGAPTLSTSADTNTPVGTYDIVATNGNLTATDYALSFVNGTLTINPAPLTITANDATRQYGMTNPPFTVTPQGLVNGQTTNALAGTLTITTSANAHSNVGAYAIVPGGWTSSNYTLNFTNGTLTVSQAPLTVTANNTNRIYGQANPALTGTRSGIIYDDELTLSFGTAATAGSPVGPYAVFPIFADPQDKLGNYLVTTNTGTLTVSPALLTVTADDQTRAYGQPNPSLTVHYSGFANEDGPTNLNEQPIASTQASPTNFLGQYPITAGGGASSNYTFSYIAGALTVTQADLTVIGDDAARAYGQSNPVFTSTITGVANGDNITVGYSTIAVPASHPGGYVIELVMNDPDGKLGEYNLTLVSGTLTVTNAALVVTVDNQNRLYGQPNPPFTVQYNGFVNGQGTNTLRGALTFSCRDSLNNPAGTNTAVGSYPITAAGLTATNYTIQYVPGTLSIGRATLNVTAASAQRTYGANNPTFTATISGFVNGETASVLGGALSVTSPADHNSPTGAYSIIPSGLTSGNYAVNFHNGTLTVTPALLTGAVASVERAYGQTNPVFSISYSGFVNSQDSSVASGSLGFSCLDTNSAAVDTNTPVGAYPIHVTTPQTAPNYTITYVDGTLTVTQAVLLVTADNQSRLYGATNQTLSVTYSGFLNADGTNVISGQPDLSTAAYDASPAGNYDIVVGLGSLSATNYSFSLTNGTLTVGKALLTVTADNQVRLYGQSNPAFTVHYSGFVDGDQENVLSGAPALTTVADTNTPVGTYDIVATHGNLTATNYALSFVNGTLTINPAPLTITANDATRQYGMTNPAFTVTIQGFVNGETTNALAGTLTITSSTDPTSDVGAYAIVPAGWTSSNYTLDFINGALTVTQAPLTITANCAVRQYGTPNPVFGGTISGLLNGDVITASFTCSAIQSSPAGVYTIVASLDDPENYAVTLVNGSLTITVALIPTATPGFYVVGSAPVFVDTNASVTDGGNLNFNGGSLTITILTNATAQDALDIEPQGTGAGQIGVQSLNVTYGGAAFATFSGGQDLNPLVFLFNTNATAESVTALMRQLTFATDNTNTNYRVIQTALTVAGNTVTARYEFTLDRPPVAGNTVITAAQGATIQFSFSQVLTNASDADGDTLTIGDFSDLSANGGWVTTNNLAFTYAPPQGLTGQDRFACIVADGRGGECVGVIIINFRPTNSLNINMSAGESTGAKLTMAGIPNRVYQIQASTNLVVWTTLSTVTADPAGIIEFLDAAAKDYPHRFYRAVAQ
ncbi:MAG: MBG domain-containing protein [Verrucomicrobiota bacterium]